MQDKQSTNVIPKSKKIQWISILQGLTMFLVVLGHSDLNEKDNIFWVGETYKFFQSFRMPLFLLISGYLFYISRIKKNRTFNFVIKDKLKRLGIPFLFFTGIALFIKIISAKYIKNPIDINNITDIFYIIIGVKENPLGSLWFIQVTFFLMLFYPIYKIILSRSWLIILNICILICIHFYFPDNISFLKISKSAHLAIFFFSGILIAHYKFDKFIQNKFISVFITLTIFSICFYFNLPNLILSFLGIIFAITFAKTSDLHFPSLFKSFRNNTYQIYLISIFPQMGIEILYRILGCQHFMLFFITNILIGLYFPILIVKLVNLTSWKWLKNCIGLS